ncbi:response regulator [Sulfurimonas sp.]|uniref:response regulator n=1 Tax=Sulfurimonas sp. TaxID=2022749 RepID=UPI00356890DD
MKFILLISILLTTYLSAATQIVIGTFSKSSSAISVKDELTSVISKDIEFKNFLEKNNIKSVTKQDGKYFLVTLEPLLDKATQTHVLNKIKSTEFKDAYVLKLVLDKVELPKELAKEEVKVEDLPVEEVKVQEVKPEKIQVEKTTPVKVEKVTPIEVKPKPVKQEIQKIKIPQPAQENFVQTYMMEIIAFILILILIVIYVFILKNKQKKLQEDLGEDIIIEDTVDSYDIQSNIEETEYEPEYTAEQEDEDILAVPDASAIEMDEEELEYEQEDELVQPESETKEPEKESTKALDPLKSTIEAKKVPTHGKISKDDFKEFEGMRVMIAEDNLINQKVIKGLLGESGIQLTIVDDGEEVLKHLENDDAFCMILMDVNMPNMDGFEATRIIRANPNYSHITVIALSGDVAADDIANMRAAGMQENLEKPLKMDALYDILYAYGYHREDKIDIQTNDDTNDSTSKELDTQTGIEVCGGDEDFYKEILSDFLNNYEGSTKTIQDFLNNNERKAAQQILLDITGVTANIGANNLQELLKNLKQELKDPEGKEYINTFKQYASHFKALEVEVKEYLS